MNEDMSSLMEQINHMIKNNEIPDDIKNIINNISNNSQNNNQDMSSTNTSHDNSAIPEFDMDTILKMKKVMDSMKSNKDDPRASLLRSLKPYLKESRQQKVDQYIQLFGIGKAFEMLNPLGGDSNK